MGENPVSRKELAYLRENSPSFLDRLQAARGRKIEYHFWQRGGGYDRNITEPQTLEEMIEYIHRNPVRSGFVQQTIDWRWSSARWYAGQEQDGLSMAPIPPEWVMNQ